MELGRTQIVCMGIFFSGASIGWGLLISLQPPFYPKEAEERGALPSQYGFVFGITNLAAFIFAPIFGAYGTQIGPKLLYNCGAFLQAISGICFGLLTFVQKLVPFLGLSYLLRFLDGTAFAATWASSVSILMKVFPNKVSTIIAWNEMFFGLGYALGPVIGVFLYDIGGFIFPFEVVGFWCLLCAFGILLSFPNVNKKTDDDTNGAIKNKLSFTDMIKYPLIFTPLIDNLICNAGLSMIEAMLEPHLTLTAGATHSEIGTTFMIAGIVYSISTPITGYVCDKIQYPIIISIFGNLSWAIAFAFIGPMPFIKITPAVPIIQGSMVFVGFGFAFCMVSSFGRAHFAAITKGYNDDMDTYIFVSGMWTFMIFLGLFLGPTLAGFSIEKYGFRATTVTFFAINFGISILNMIQLISSSKDITIKGYKQLPSNIQNSFRVKKKYQDEAE